MLPSRRSWRQDESRTQLRLPVALLGLSGLALGSFFLLPLLHFRSALRLREERGVLGRPAPNISKEELHQLLQAETEAEAQAFGLQAVLPLLPPSTPPPPPPTIGGAESRADAAKAGGDASRVGSPALVLCAVAGADPDDLAVDFVMGPLLQNGTSHNGGLMVKMCREDVWMDGRQSDGTPGSSSPCSPLDGKVVDHVQLLVSRETITSWNARRVRRPATSSKSGLVLQPSVRSSPIDVDSSFPQLQPLIPHAGRTPFLIVLLRDPFEALIAEYNGRFSIHAGSNGSLAALALAYSGGEFGPVGYVDPVVRFASTYRRLLAGRNILTCTLAGQAASLCEGRAGRVEGALRKHMRRRRKRRRQLDSSDVDLAVMNNTGSASVSRRRSLLSGHFVASSPSDDAMLAKPPAHNPGQEMAAEDLAVWRLAHTYAPVSPAPLGWSASALFGAYLVPRDGRPAEAQLQRWKRQAGERPTY